MLGLRTRVVVHARAPERKRHGAVDLCVSEALCRFGDRALDSAIFWPLDQETASCMAA